MTRIVDNILESERIPEECRGNALVLIFKEDMDSCGNCKRNKADEPDSEIMQE